MILRFCNLIINQFEKANTISEHNKELYVYGLHQMIIMILNILITLMIGYILSMLWQSILFLITYIPIRTYAGGYHAKTPLMCYCLSVILVIAILLVMKMIEIPLFVCITGITLSSICIILLAPVQDPNKPFTEKEKMFFRKKTRIFLFAEVIICILGFIFHWSMVYFSIFMSFATISLMLILGKIKNHFMEKNLL